MKKEQIIKEVQAGNNIMQHENIFIPMTDEQWKARRENFINTLKANIFKLGQRARFKGQSA